MQNAVLNLALEQLEAATNATAHLFGLAARLEKGEFTMELSLEADRLLPQLGLAGLYFSTIAGKQQIALEGILESIWAMISKMIEAIGKAFKALMKFLFGEAKKAEELEKKLTEVEQVNEELKSVSDASGIKDLDQWVNSYLTKDHSHSTLKYLLGAAPWQVREYVSGVSGAGDGYGRLMYDLAHQVHNVELYLDFGMVKQLEEMKSLLQDVLAHKKFPDRPPELIALVREYEMKLPTLHHGSKSLVELVDMETHLREQLDTNAGPVELRELRLAILTNHSYDKIAQLAKSLQKVQITGKKTDDLIDEIGQISHKLGEAHASGEIPVPLYHTELSQAIQQMHRNMRAIVGYHTHVTAHYVDMASVMLEHWLKVVRAIVQALKAADAKLEPHETDSLAHTLDKKI